MKKNDLYTQEKLDEIFQYIQCISLFILKGNHYFIISDKEYFELDLKPGFDAYLEDGIIDKYQYQEYKKYRGGIWQLTQDNFKDFLKLEEVLVLEKEDLLSLLFHNFGQEEQKRLYGVVENQLAFNAGISQEGELSDFKKINQIASRLPLFYINFDTNVYLHMNWDRCHEDYAYDDWFSKAMDFGYLVPDEHCYWKIDGKDFWKFRQI